MVLLTEFAIAVFRVASFAKGFISVANEYKIKMVRITAENGKNHKSP